MEDSQIIDGANYTIETPKSNKDYDIINNVFDNKSSFSSYSQTIII